MMMMMIMVVVVVEFRPFVVSVLLVVSLLLLIRPALVNQSSRVGVVRRHPQARGIQIYVRVRIWDGE